jgi:hypothetical protein
MQTITIFQILEQWSNLGGLSLQSAEIYVLTYLLTPWSRVLPEKLKRPELLKKFPAFMETEGS